MAQPGPALECNACDTITPVDDPKNTYECPNCGDEWVQAVMVEACGAAHPADCGDENHHFGIQMHVKEIA